MKQTLTLTNRVHVPFGAQPIRQGVPWPPGAVRPETPLVATDERGAPVPVASRVLNCWPDGSVQWSLLDLALDFAPSAKRTVTVSPGNPTPANPLSALTIESWEAGQLDVLLTDTTGTVFSALRCATKKIHVEESNPLRTTVRVDGKHQAADGRTLLEYWIRFTTFAGRRDVRVTYHYRNRESAEPGIEIKSLVLELHSNLPANAQRVIMQVNRGRHFRTEPYRLAEDFELCSSHTMDLAHYSKAGGGNGRVFIRQAELLRDDPMTKPWFLRNVVDFKFQSKDMPEAYTWSWLGLVSEQGSLVVAGANMVGLHPKSLAVAGNVIRYSIWPEWAGVMDITQGEGRTLDFFVGPLPPNADDRQLLNQYLSWELSGLYAHWSAQSPIEVSLNPTHVRQCVVFQVDKLPAQEHFAFERKVQAQWTPDEAAPANGHWHYGDVFYRWDIGGNNEEMHGHMWFQEYLRTGRFNCLARGLAQAQHILDVDICAYSADPYQNGGMCSHGPRHNHSAAYPSHTWFTELLFAYALTGDGEFLTGARRVCDNLVFWVNDPAGFDIICADGRESGQPLINLAWTFQFAPEPRYRAAMDKIVRESFMVRAAKHGSLVYLKPREDLPLLRQPGYGEWAAWEGLFCVWELTRDKALHDFILAQLDWRLKEELMGTHGAFRNTDYNMAAYAYYLTGDRQWLDRVARPFRAMFRGVQWPFGYIKAMYFIKLAFDLGIITDDEVLLS